jgi:hypothetical protein
MKAASIRHPQKTLLSQVEHSTKTEASEVLLCSPGVKSLVDVASSVNAQLSPPGSVCDTGARKRSSSSATVISCNFSLTTTQTQLAGE